MWFFNRGPVVPVLRFDGPIGHVTPLRPGLAISSCATAIERAFELSKVPSVAVVINSPGGSAVQSSLIFRRIRQFAEETRKTVHVFCEDVAASGGYYLAVAGDEIYADAASIVGSIGVIFAGFGFVDAIEKLGITRRVYTAGADKGSLDSFRPERADDVERLKSLQQDVHDVFIGVVKERRAGRLKGADQVAVLRRLLVGHKGARARPHRWRQRRAHQDARAPRRQGAAEGRAVRPRRPAVALATRPVGIWLRRFNARTSCVRRRSDIRCGSSRVMVPLRVVTPRRIRALARQVTGRA